MSSSPGQVLKHRIKTLERRIDFLESKEYKNDWDKAEIAALDLVLDVVEEHPDTAKKIIQELKGIG